MSGSQQISLLRRSIFWLCILIAVAGVTYHYQENIFKEGFDSLTATNTPKDIPICNVKTNKKLVSLSFDADFGNEDIEKILSVLKKYDVKTTFFITGNWVEKYPEAVKKMQAAGHDLGNHSYHHKHMPELDAAGISDEINTVTEKVKELTGVTMNLFRPPYGDYSNALLTQAKSLNYYAIQWNIDSQDWKNYGTDSIVSTILNHKDLKNGSIILMHNGAKYTAEALPKVIEGLKKKGYEIVPVSNLIYMDNSHIEPDGSQVQDTSQ